MQKQIYIAEDDENIRMLEKAFLEKSNFLVETFETGDALYQAFQKQKADLIILDIMMPGTDGLSLCSILRSESSVPIIIVSAKGSDMERVAGITMGCDDYLSKPFSPVELVARVQAIFRRMDMMQSETESAENKLIYGDLTVDLDRRETFKEDKPIDLTANEFNLLSYLIQNKNRAVSRDELLSKLWDFSHDSIDTRATDDTMKRLRKKLNDAGSSVKIDTIRGFGFRIG